MTSQRHYETSPTWVRDYDDSVAYMEIKRAVVGGPSVIMLAGREVKDAWVRGKALVATRHDIRQSMSDIFGNSLVAAAEVAVEERTLQVDIRGLSQPLFYHFQLITFSGQRPSLVLPANSFAAHLRDTKERSLLQGVAYQLLTALCGCVDEDSEEYRARWMHHLNPRAEPLSGLDLTKIVRTTRMDKKLSWEDEQAKNWQVANFMLS